MATQSPPNAITSVIGASMSLLDLGQDILHLIVEQLNITDASFEIQTTGPTYSLIDIQRFPKLYYQQHKSLPVLRLVCETFNQVVLPIRFRTFTLKLTDLESDVAKLVIADVLKWTRCVILNHSVDWALIERVYVDGQGVVLPKMENIKWTFAPFERNKGVLDIIIPIPSSLLRPDTRISISNKTEIYTLLPLLSCWHVSHLDIGYWQHVTSYGERTDPAPMKDFLLLSSNLKTFRYAAKGPDPWLQLGDVMPFPAFTAGEKMPALESLTLLAYQWNHTATEVESSWDFTHLTFLDLRGVPLYAFLSTVPFASFSQLKVLKIGDLSCNKKEELRNDGLLLLESFLRHLPQLQELYLTGQNGAITLETFSRLPNLRILECRAEIYMSGEGEKNISFTRDQIAELRKHCPNIRELSIHMDIISTDFPTYLTTLRSFPHLKTVTLYTDLYSWDPTLNKPPPDAVSTTPATTTPAAAPNSRKRRPNARYSMLEATSNQLVKTLFQRLTVSVGGHNRVSSPVNGLEGRNMMWSVERVFVWSNCGKGRTL